MCPRGIAVTTGGELCDSPEEGVKCASECFTRLGKEKTVSRFTESCEFVKSVNAIISPTYFLADMFRNVFKGDVRVIRHGINYEGIKPNSRVRRPGDEVVFGYIGTILPHKGVHIILEAFRLLDDKNIKIKIYGQSPTHEKAYFEYLKSMVRDSDKVQLFGEYKDSELTSIMSEVDCILVPSIWWENSPLTLLTSLAYKVPVITINIGGGAELVKDGLNGFTFEISNAQSLAEKMGKILDDPQILNKIKDNILRPPRSEEEAFEYESLFLDVLGKSSPQLGTQVVR
jgi:glycosyltransferase involved in cell wall biosynthesis